MRYISSTHLFKALELPLSGFRRKSPCSYTNVAEHYKKLFSKFSVREWNGFNREAAKLMVGKRERRIPEDLFISYKCFEANWKANPPPSNEGRLATAFETHVLTPTNRLLESSSEKWVPNSNRSKKTSMFQGRTPDYSLCSARAGSSSTQTTDLSDHQLVVGELKTPCVDLGSELTAASLTNRIRGKDALGTANLCPFFQLFSYILHSEKGVGFLSNYDHMRFFKINLKDIKSLLMSPLVKIDQRLDDQNGIPHPIQALLYMIELRNPSEKEFSTREANRLLTEAKDYQKGEQRKEQERKNGSKTEGAAKMDSGESSSKQSKSKGGGSSSGSKGGRKRNELDSEEIFSAVSGVMERCEVIGSVGCGVTGEVLECDLDGTKVAVKVGLEFDGRYDERDCFFHVKREIKIYEVLKELQGSVIPRVVIGGMERWYTPSAMVLITEKVGEGVEERDDKIFVGEMEVSREDLIVMKEKGLEGLERMHACGVVHVDSKLRNTRVELKDGKVDRVWWIDLGDACEIDHETGLVWYEYGEDEREVLYSEEEALKADTRVYASEFGKYLKDT